MVKYSKLLIFILILFILISISCKTSTIGINIIEPAEIKLPKYINSVAIINRCFTHEESKKLSDIKLIINNENLYNKQLAINTCLYKMEKILQNSARFDIKKIPDSMQIYGSGGEIISAYLGWKDVAEICKSVDADALIILESLYFDSFFNKYYNDSTKALNSINYNVNLNTYWRIYDYKNQKIIFENYVSKSELWQDVNLLDYENNNIISNEDVIYWLSENIANKFAYYISPIWIWEDRIYYKNRNKDFKKAHKLALKDDWDKAARYWKKQVKNKNRKIAGMACYNMALVAEIKKNWDLAIYWASKSYYIYKFEPALGYMNTLKKQQAKYNEVIEQL